MCNARRNLLKVFCLIYALKYPKGLFEHCIGVEISQNTSKARTLYDRYSENISSAGAYRATGIGSYYHTSEKCRSFICSN